MRPQRDRSLADGPLLGPGLFGPGMPGLLSWQVCFLAYLAGIWSLREQQAGLAAACALWLGLVVLRERTIRRAALFLALLAGCLAAGYWQAGRALPPVPERLAACAEGRGKAMLRATVEEITDKPFGRLEIMLSGVTAETPEGGVEALPGRLAWDWDEPEYRPAPGQTLEGQLRVRPVRGFKNPGGADFDWQQRLRGVFYRCYTSGSVEGLAWGPVPSGSNGLGDGWRLRLWQAREGLRESVLRALPPGQGGAVVLGLLLGDRSRINLEVTEELRAAGLAHTLALSGLNVVYVAVIGWALAWAVGLACPGLLLRLPRAKLAVLLSAPLIAAYVWVGGGGSSLLRSALMFAFWGLLLLLDRPRALIDGLFFALAAIILPAPLAVFDVSLQMSALAVAGLCIVQPWLAGLVRFPQGLRPWLRPPWEALCLSVSSNMALLPVTIWYFGVFPPNILPNLPWLPVQGFVVQVLGMLGMALVPVPGFAHAGAAFIGWASWVQQGMLEALHYAAGRDWLPVWALLRPRWPELLGVGLVIALVPVHWRAPHKAPWALIVSGLLLCAAPHFAMLAEEGREQAALEVLDVGQSQALVLSGPGGVRVLVDGGGSMSRTFDLGRSVVGPALAWGRPPRLDAVFLSHPDTDHAQGLVFVLRHFQVGALYTNGQWPGGELGAQLEAAVEENRVPVRSLRRSDVVALGGGLALHVRHPAEGFESRKSNENSLVLQARWRGVPIALLPGDVQRGGIEDMVDAGQDLRAQVLVLPHHGSKSSLSGMLYEGAAPVFALASCGYQNMYGFPNPAVSRELAAHGIPLAATSEQGWLRVRWLSPDSGPELYGVLGRVHLPPVSAPAQPPLQERKKFQASSSTTGLE